MPEEGILQNLASELKRGSLTLAVLSCLFEPRYGYALLQLLQEHGLDIEANTLYPLLRRLEGQGLLTSDWDTAESRPRKYYSLSSLGKDVYQELIKEWEKIHKSVDSLIDKKKAKY